MKITDAKLGDFLAWFNADLPSWVVWEGDERLAIAGITLNPAEGRWWGYFDLRDGAHLTPAAGAALALSMRRGLETVGYDVYATCQEEDFMTAPRLLRLIGFYPTNEHRDGLEVWVCPGTAAGE